MRIFVLPHDEAHKRELFGLIGEFCASSAVRNALGAPISSVSGRDTWLVAMNDDEVTGFCALQALKNGKTAKLHALYGKQPKVTAKLRKEALQLAKIKEIQEISVIDRDSLAPVYQAEGWLGNHVRGQYVTYSRVVE